MIIKADLDELVFRSRNKEYGSYELRKRYQRTTGVAVLIAAAAMTLAALSPKIVEALKPEETAEETGTKKVVYAELQDPPPINEDTPPPPPPTQALPPPPQRATIKFVPPEVVKEEEADPEEEFAEVEDLNKNVSIGTKTEGDPDAGGIDFGDPEGLEGGEAPVELKEPVDQEPDINAFVPVEQQPAPVNMDQFKKALGYPPIAREMGIEGQVVVRVLVDKFGNYKKHKVISSPHQSLTKAVEDNLTMLKFTPGIQAGKPIQVWVNVPVRFNLN